MVLFSKIPDIDMSVGDILSIAETDASLSPPLSHIIIEANRVLVVSGFGVSSALLEAVLEKCGDKLGGIIVFEDGLLVNEKYSDKIITLNPSNFEDYKYFGVTNGKTPILLHKCVLEHDAGIVLSGIHYDGLSGFAGAPSLVFPGLAAEKSADALLLKGLAFDLVAKTDLCRSGITKNNPLDKEIKEAIVTSSAGMVWFGINLLSKNGKTYGATCGDLLLSYVLAQKIYDEYNAFEVDKLFDGMVLEISGKNLQKSISVIEAVTGGLMKGGRLLIKAPHMDVFGSGSFRNFFDMTSIEDIYKNMVSKAGFNDPYDASVLKKICMNYHVSIESKLDSGDVIQSGLNPLAEGGGEKFLQNCSNTGKIIDAARFTIIQ